MLPAHCSKEKAPRTSALATARNGFRCNMGAPYCFLLILSSILLQEIFCPSNLALCFSSDYPYMLTFSKNLLFLCEKKWENMQNTSQEKPQQAGQKDSMQNDVAQEQPHAKAKTNMADILQDKQHKELLFYLSVAIFFLELIVGGIAFFYGIIHATPGENGGPPQFQFPWLTYGIAAIVAPAALLLIVHMAGVGLFRSMNKKTPEEEAAWRENLPQRLQKVYAIIQGAPAIMLFLGVILVGVALFYVDGAISALMRMGEALAPYWPYIIGGSLGSVCVIYVGKAYFAYRTRRMQEEYAFRREIFERTGQILVDKGTVQLPPAYDVGAATHNVALDGNVVTVEALPQAEQGSPDAVVDVVTDAVADVAHAEKERESAVVDVTEAATTDGGTESVESVKSAESEDAAGHGEKK